VCFPLGQNCLVLKLETCKDPFYEIHFMLSIVPLLPLLWICRCVIVLTSGLLIVSIFQCLSVDIFYWSCAYDPIRIKWFIVHWFFTILYDSIFVNWHIKLCDDICKLIELLLTRYEQFLVMFAISPNPLFAVYNFNSLFGYFYF